MRTTRISACIIEVKNNPIKTNIKKHLSECDVTKSKVKMDHDLGVEEQLKKGIVSEDDGCVEILMPGETISNGAADESGTTMLFFEEEQDTENDTEDMNEMEQKMENQDDVIEELDEEEGEENDGMVEYVNDGIEEELEEEGEVEEEIEEEPPVQRLPRTPTQVPKKRKDAVMLAAVAAEEEEIEAKKKQEQQEMLIKQEHEERPTSTSRAAANKADTVDEEQCRVCTAKEDLVSLFKKVEQSTVAEMLMIICPSVSIARKDFMPQYICNPCMDNVTIAVQLKAQCETTERELRKKLSRSKNKVRRPTGYVVIDAHVESDPPSEEEPNDDVEFKVSDEEVTSSASIEDDSDDSDFSSSKKKRPGRGSGGKRGRRKYASMGGQKFGEKKRMGRPPMKRPLAATSTADDGNSSADDYGEHQSSSAKKQKRRWTGNDAPPTEYPCDECEQVFYKKLSLVLHKKAHSGSREPINCEVCGKQFKIVGAYRTHLEKHKQTPLSNCNLCDKFFATKSEMRRHMSEDHGHRDTSHQCSMCHRNFVSEARLACHQETRCRGVETKQRKGEYEGLGGGKDLFKSVAPLTTTYWSDSYSD